MPHRGFNYIYLNTNNRYLNIMFLYVINLKFFEKMIVHLPIKYWRGMSQDFRLPIRCIYKESTTGAHKSFKLNGHTNMLK